MLRWALIFFVIALVAAIFGFGGIVAGASFAARVLFFVFLAFAIIMVMTRLASAGPGQRSVTFPWHQVSLRRSRRKDHDA